MVDGLPTVGLGSRAWHVLRTRRATRLALLVLGLLGSLAVFAPLIANDRPYVLVAVRTAEFERARRGLLPPAMALGELLARGRSAHEQARAGTARPDFDTALAAEGGALEQRIRTLRSALPAERGAEVEAFAEEVSAAVRAGREADDTPPARVAERVVEEARALRTSLEGASLRPTRTFPLFAALAPLEVAFMVAWVLLLTVRRWGRRRTGRRVLGALALATGAGFLWALVVGSGSPFDGGHEKADLAAGGITPELVVFPPIPYGYAEQHPEENLRPPTWLAAAELAPDGTYLRGARVARPDPVTGFVPETRPVEVRPGEPGLNAPGRHWLGTDWTGRDQLARLVHGARASLLVGFLATAILMLVGTAIGALAGSAGERVDLVLSRLIEVVISFPVLFLLLLLVTFLGPSIWNVIVILGLVGWTGTARLARAEFLRERELDHVAAARTLGYSPLRIAVRHVLPNALAPLLVHATFAVAGAILTESALSYLGFGVRTPIASWGSLASESRELAYWWLQLFPGLALLVTVLSVHAIGDALRDALDVRGGRR
jgi:peptide/nickel transport system permease protein